MNKNDTTCPSFNATENKLVSISPKLRCPKLALNTYSPGALTNGSNVDRLWDKLLLVLHLPLLIPAEKVWAKTERLSYLK
jgi:hypothetical protein